MTAVRRRGRSGRAAALDYAGAVLKYPRVQPAQCNSSDPVGCLVVTRGSRWALRACQKQARKHVKIPSVLVLRSGVSWSVFSFFSC